MIKIGPLEVLNAIICDDIRREDNGKQILIGVYNDIRLANIPSLLNVCMWVQYNSTSDSPLPINYHLTCASPNDTFENGLQGRFVINQPGLANLCLLHLMLQINRSGNLLLELRVGDNLETEFVPILSTPVVLNRPAFNS